MKRVILFSSEYPPHILGGLGTHVKQITSSLAKWLTIDLFLPARGSYQVLPGVRLHEVPVDESLVGPQYWLEFSYRAAHAAYREAHEADLIHCHDWMTALAGLKARALLGRPLVFNIHLPQHYGSSLLMENLGLAGADLVLVNSRAVKDELATRQVPWSSIEVLPNGVDLEVFHPDQDWPTDDGYILFVGRLVPQKGVDTLLLAFSILLRRYPSSRLLIAGDGFFELYFHRLARHLGIPERVSFLDWQTEDSLVPLYQRARAVVIPSCYEPFGIVALEAMACGRPVIASRVGGLEEIIQHGVQGYLFSTGDHLDLARRLALLTQDARLACEMGKAARQHVYSFSWSRIAASLLDLYEDLNAMPIADEFSAHFVSLAENLLERFDDNVRKLAEALLRRSEVQ